MFRKLKIQSNNRENMHKVQTKTKYKTSKMKKEATRVERTSRLDGIEQETDAKRDSGEYR